MPTYLCPGCGRQFRSEGDGAPAVCPRCRHPDATATPGGGSATVGTSNATPAPVGERVAGYEILSELSRGGMGVVYLARQVGLDRLVALKMVLAGPQADPADLARFRVEGEAVARLQHPNIVRIYEVGEHDGRPFFSMDYCAGGGLDKRLGTPMRDPHAAELVEVLARAVHAAHEANIIHRDLKPGNILFTADDVPRIIDFGLAKKLDEQSHTQTGSVMGTPSYMSPEQAEGKKDVGPAADIYSLGAILYECLTGRPPFKGASPLDTVVQVAKDDPVPPRRLNPRTHPDLETVCVKCLRKEPHRRYATALALADDLARFRAGEPIAARPVGRAERAWPWCRRNPAGAAAGALAAVLLAAAIAVPAVLAVREKKANAKIQAALRQSRIQSATSTLERALLLCEQGEINQGVLWLTRGLQIARLAEDEDLEQAYRWNLGAWAREINRLERMLPHPAAVRAVAFSPDGTLLATGCADGKVRLWDAATGELRGEPLEHPRPVHALAFHPKGGRLLTGCGDGVARLWRVGEGEAPLAFRHYTPPQEPTLWPYCDGILGVSFSPDGKRFITGGRDGTARVWDSATGKAVGQPIRPPGGDVLFAVAYRPDGKAVLTGGGDWTLQQWDPDTSKRIGPAIRHSYTLGASYRADGKRIVAGYLQGHHAVQWDLAGRAVATPPLQHNEAVWSACYSPDGRMVLTGGQDQTARLWDAEAGQPIGSAMEHTGPVFVTAFSPDGKSLATGCGDHVVRIWKVAPRSLARTMAHQGWVRALAFSPDGGRLLTGCSDGSCRLWDLDRGQALGPVMKQSPMVVGVSFSADGKTAVAVSNKGPALLYRWDLADGRLIESAGQETDEPWRVAFSPDRKTCVTGCLAFSACIWDADTLRPRGERIRLGKPVRGVAVSPDGKTVLTGSDDKTTRLWDIATGKAIGDAVTHPNTITAVAFSADGTRILTGSADRTARLWDAASWEPAGAPMVQRGAINAVAFVDGTPLLVSSADDNTARLWFAPTGHQVGPSLRHGGPVHSVAVSPSARALATGGDDTTARIWSMPSPAAEEPEHLVGWIEALTGMGMDSRGSYRALPAEEWRSRRDEYLRHR